MGKLKLKIRRCYRESEYKIDHVIFSKSKPPEKAQEYDFERYLELCLDTSKLLLSQLSNVGAKDIITNKSIIWCHLKYMFPGISRRQLGNLFGHKPCMASYHFRKVNEYFASKDKYFMEKLENFEAILIKKLQ